MTTTHKVARIWVDGRGYQGEHIDEVAGVAEVGPGWQPQRRDMDKLVFGDRAHDICSPINIEGHIRRIMTHLRHGYITAERIEIELRDEPYGYRPDTVLVHGWHDETEAT